MQTQKIKLATRMAPSIFPLDISRDREISKFYVHEEMIQFAKLILLFCIAFEDPCIPNTWANHRLKVIRCKVK
ncbi:hypothetical protein LXL04_032399 [Taraxacum kok-saghyz]